MTEKCHPGRVLRDPGARDDIGKIDFLDSMIYSQHSKIRVGYETLFKTSNSIFLWN